MTNISQEYIAAIVLLAGAVLKIFKIEIDNTAIEGLVAGVLSLWIAYRRYSKGDITLGGIKIRVIKK